MYRRLGPVWAGLAIVSGLMCNAVVSPLYPLYRQAWSLEASDITTLHVIYMCGALSSLLVFGRLADRFGYTLVLMGGLVLCLIATSLTIVADGFAIFCVARFIVGVASSLITTAGTVAMMSMARGPAMAVALSLVMASGFASGPLIGGLSAHLSDRPLVGAHLPGLALLVLSLVLVAIAVPRQIRRGAFRWHDLVPRLSWSAPEHARAFALTCGLPFLGFGIFGLYVAVSPMLIREYLGIGGPLVIGLYVGFYLTFSAGTQYLLRGLPSRQTAVGGLVLGICGNTLMLINLWAGLVWLFMMGVLISALAHGLMMMVGARGMHAASQPHNRGAISATYWACGYSGSIFPLLGLGWIADRWGMGVAVATFCIAMSLLMIALATATGRHRTA